MASAQSREALTDFTRTFYDEGDVVQIFSSWYDVVIPALRKAFRDSTDHVEEVDVESGILEIHIAAWNAIGAFAVIRGRPHFAEELFSALLEELRALQPRIGRVHKGTPYHQIGWSKAEAGDFEGAQEYFVYAVIEDLISIGGDPEGLETPASLTLMFQYGFTSAQLNDLLMMVRSKTHKTDPLARLRFENPELLFLDNVRTESILPSRSEE
jgi:hypothetical protein